MKAERTAVSNAEKWSWEVWAAHFAVDVAMLIGAVWMAIAGYWIWAFGSSGLGMLFLSETLLLFYEQQQSKEISASSGDPQ